MDWIQNHLLVCEGGVQFFGIFCEFHNSSMQLIKSAEHVTLRCSDWILVPAFCHVILSV